MWQRVGKHLVRKWSMGLKETSWISVAEGTRALFNFLFPKWRTVLLWPNTIVIGKGWDPIITAGANWILWCLSMATELGILDKDIRWACSSSLYCLRGICGLTSGEGWGVPSCMWSVCVHSNIADARQACPTLVVSLLFFQWLQQVFRVI